MTEPRNTDFEGRTASRRRHWLRLAEPRLAREGDRFVVRAPKDG